ncbi:MAG: hypothetical protein MK082_09895 [Phycisphaerales bacterium]|nr:hypothetical protein [Phycisphaerales bacterium]
MFKTTARWLDTVDSLMTLSKPASPIGLLLGLFLTACACFDAPVSAQDPKPPSGADLVGTSAFASVAAVRPGEPFQVAVRYRMKPHWHIYWKNAGGSGQPPILDLKVPEGFVIGPVQWPTPEVFPGADASYGYAGEVVLLIPVTPPDRLDVDRVSFKLDLEWLVCRRVCLFGNREHLIELPVSTGAEVPPISESHQRLLEHWRARLPRSIRTIKDAGARLEGDRLIVEGPIESEADVVWFYPDDTPGVSPAIPSPVKGRIDAGRFLLDVPLTISPENALGGPLRVAGLVVPRKTGRSSIMIPSIAIELPIPVGDAFSSTTDQDKPPPVRGGTPSERR